MTRILVLYGTTDGHTAKVARAITEALSTHGVQADVVDVARADPDPSGYTGAIVAASVHAGGFQKTVQRWVITHHAALGGIRTAFIGVCLGILQHDPKVDRELDAIVARFLAPTGWQPDERKLIAGALRYTHYHWVKRWMMRRACVLEIAAPTSRHCSRSLHHSIVSPMRKTGSQEHGFHGRGESLARKRGLTADGP